MDSAKFQTIKWKIPNCSKEWAEKFENKKEMFSESFQMFLQSGTELEM
jgi:hypothetical protein